jgi:hypothetical protein
MISTSRYLSALGGLLVAATLTSFAQSALPTGPEGFTAEAKVTTDVGVASSTIVIQLNRYTPEPDRKAMADALRYHGFVGFRPIFSKAPVVGTGDPGRPE